MRTIVYLMIYYGYVKHVTQKGIGILMKLRDYQSDAVSAVWDDLKRQDTSLLVMSCGLGKTECAFGLVEKAILAKPDIKILFAVNKVELVKQTVKRAKHCLKDVNISSFCGSLNEKNISQFTVASVQSLAKKKALPIFHLIIFDEAHRINISEGSQYQNIIERSKENNPKLKIVGLTATPFRNDGYIYGEGKLFSKISYCKDIKWAIDKGWLVRPSMKFSNERFETQNLRTRLGDFDMKQLKEITANEVKASRQIADAMPKIKDRKKIIWHTTSIAHAEMIQRLLPEESVMVHSKMKKCLREKNLQKFKSTGIRHLVFILIVSEGFDEPCIDTVILMRPTKSPVLYIQTVGRSLRRFPGKKDALILDYGETVVNCGPLDKPHVKEGGSRSRVRPTDMKFCPECLEYLETKIVECPSCGHSFKQEIDYMKKLSTRAKEGKLFSDKTNALEWIEVNPDRSNVSVYESKAGNTCLKFTFRPSNILSTTASYNKFVIIESSNKFLDGRAPMIVRNIVGEIVSARTAEDYEREIVENNMLSRIYKIQVDRRGKYPDITGFKRYEATAQRA